ncbi:hypothetical protein HNV12_04955 [Methanococcoides sp. SA1]|nr:hypothetical protein [Methanococcoides sp. SA1]
MKIKRIKNLIKYISFCILTSQLLQAGIFHVPFQKIANMIVVKAEINGNVENFIFDTGAKTLVLNSNYIVLEENNIGKTHEVRGIGSKISDVQSISVKDFKLAEIEKNNFEALVMNISLIEKLVGNHIFGLIGYEVFSGYDIVVDYKKSQLTFLPAARFMDYWNQNVVNRPFTIQEFVLFDYLPIINAKAGEKNIKLGVDTGSGKTLIDKNTIDLIQYEIINIQTKSIIGIDNKELEIKSGTIRQLIVGQKKYKNIEILIKDISHINDKISNKVDGLIGYDILKHYKTIISYSNNKFVFVE